MDVAFDGACDGSVDDEAFQDEGCAKEEAFHDEECSDDEVFCDEGCADDEEFFDEDCADDGVFHDAGSAAAAESLPHGDGFDVGAFKDGPCDVECGTSSNREDLDTWDLRFAIKSSKPPLKKERQLGAPEFASWAF